LHLLQQGRPMIEYELFMPLFEFLALPKNKKKTLKWQLQLDDGKIHALEVMKASKATTGAIQYVAFSCDEIFTFNNQS
jgi:hypothetical protein